MKIHPTKFLYGALIWLAVCGVGMAQQPPAPAPASGKLMVVELFQSQGCSSCPPAAANLNAIAERPDVLALSFGVTYWDQLGWKDTFASKAYTDRQWDYAKHHHHDNVWTPQIYINGHTDLVGTDRAQLEQAIATATADTPQGPLLTWTNKQLSIGAGKPAAPCDVWLVRYDPRMVNVPVRAGENNGRTLPHRNVVRELVRLGTWDGTAQSYAVPAASRRGLATAALLQGEKGGDILGASQDSAAR